MSFTIKYAIRKEISGLFRLLSQSTGRIKNLPSMTNKEHKSQPQIETMANQSESSIEEIISMEESEIAQTPDHVKERRRSTGKKDTGKGVVEDHIFLRHLELDPLVEEDATARREGSPPPPVSSQQQPQQLGRTPFTTTRTIKRRPGTSYGFSIAWTHPPRIERVEAGLPAEQAGLRPGDYVIFVEKTNVVMLQEEEILKLIKSCGNQIVLEVYRKTSSVVNGVFSRLGGGGAATTVPPSNTSSRQIQQPSQQPSTQVHHHRPPTACSATTTTGTTSIELTKRRLHLTQVAFNNEVGSGIIV